jgi:Domain of unknown function (DUF4158)
LDFALSRAVLSSDDCLLICRFFPATLVGPAFAPEWTAMEHWRLAYLGMRRMPPDLSEFELATFFAFSSKERALINARRDPLYRLALALHIRFVRMTGATLDAYQYVPQILWGHLGKHLGIEPPDLGTLRTLYEARERTRFDHQVIAY